MKATLRPLMLALLAALCVLVGAQAQAQPLTWDHYKVYRVLNPGTGSFPVLLRDQFMGSQNQATVMDLFANPVEKQVFNPPPGQVYPITKPQLHYTWWRINPVPFGALVTLTNQFGNQTIKLSQVEYLLNPAQKDTIDGPLPLENHYTCYACQGNPVNVSVLLRDQWDIWQTLVGKPRWFCTPVEKTVPGLPPNPIVEPNRNYVVYDFNPIDPGVFPAIIRDQFRQGVHDMNPGLYLMVPTEKLHVTDAKSSSWGRVKVLYR
jgi:hypothetical protein